LPVLYGYSALNGNTIDQFYRYPGRDSFGIDLSGEVFSIGWWAEGAYVRPENITGFVEVPVLFGEQPQVIKQEFPLFENEYFKYVIGGDYTIGVGNGIYLNVQYLHGFFDERNYSGQYQELLGFKKGMFFGELGDYLVVRAEYKMLNEILKMGFGGIVEFSDNGTAVAYMPSLEYRVLDYVIIQAGAFITSGDELKTKFGVFKKDKLIFLLLKVDF
ncbi:MAG: hypothetical protein Q9M37_09925, partial [Desulfonauticus sp.]|nr:hypothetical protein [Desulfonauticus sp.]